MGFDVDVSCSCTGCHSSIDDGEEVYCEACYSGETNEDTAAPDDIRCGGCKKMIAKSLVIEKLPGPRCRKCAAQIELEIMAKLAPNYA